jgi:putative DNA primase/helicase
VAEGFVTAATIYQATLRPVFVCFDAGNLEPVIKNLKDKYPSVSIVIATDNAGKKYRRQN